MTVYLNDHPCTVFLVSLDRDPLLSPITNGHRESTKYAQLPRYNLTAELQKSPDGSRNMVIMCQIKLINIYEYGNYAVDPVDHVYPIYFIILHPVTVIGTGQ